MAGFTLSLYLILKIVTSPELKGGESGQPGPDPGAMDSWVHSSSMKIINIV